MIPMSMNSTIPGTRTALAGLALMAASLATSAAAAPPERLAAESDMVVLAQLERVDYEYTRGFPVDGRAWFKVLIPYKMSKPMERIIVHESGLKDIECYFPDDPRALEQPRYLLFLQEREDGKLWGHPEGCFLEILVTGSGRYAVRWPQDFLELSEEGRALVQELTFQGPLARIDASDETRTARADQAERYHMRIDGTDLHYTRGILLGDFRPLMGDGLSLEDRDRPTRAELTDAAEESEEAEEEESGDG